MNILGRGPRGGGPMLWFLTAVLVVMSAKVDSIVADLICVGLAVYAAWAHHVEGR